MGSSGSRPSASAVDATEGSKRFRKNKQNFLVPLLRSMSCGTSSSWRTDSFLQETPITPGDRLSYKISSEKSATCDGQSGTCQLQSCEDDANNREGSDENSSDNVSAASYQSLCGSVESTRPTLFDRSNIVDDASLSLGQSHMPYHKADRFATSISRSVEANTSIAESLPTTFTCHDDLSSNQTTSEGHENNVGTSLPRVSRAEDTSCCTPELENSVNYGESGRPYVSLQHGPSMAMNSSSSQVTVSLEDSVDLGGLQNESSGLVSHALDDFSISRGELSGREARRNNGRRLWDALTRASSRRRRFTPSFVQDVAADGSRTLNDDWGLFDWNSSDLSSGFSYESDFLSRRSSNTEERRMARPQVWALQQFSDSIAESSGQPRYCAFGRHPNGHCSCEAFVMTEESSTRASISRIVMLAEALFEVLDEIHRQSVTLSRSTSISLVSSPAPEAVVDSFATRIHTKSDPSVSVLGQCAECYICLTEYEDGDHIRVLPCCHEFHMSCVDRWLKEAHRVCPLCRHNGVFGAIWDDEALQGICQYF
ncbi:hypothetical protein GOP47_0001322 [Adiantum capillus-veneris]|uniref:RING-type domain-containing protein n=1 Tax=Adiantum capillus-veneris TaxID=13818 RepID=A0A9D4ZN43_ADICA|nr:hypothetical protein GOP47_0001322 [Adiantum capillus-veneris]